MIYTIGSIAVSGNTLTGTGTNFKAPLSMIRVGCTVIVKSNPIQIFSITEIVSETELSVTPAASPDIPAGTAYSILLCDSISVDGLAQDVAEALRYFTGQESEIYAAVEYWKNYGDAAQVEALLAAIQAETAQSNANAAATAADVETTAAARDEAITAKNAAEDYSVLAGKHAATATTQATTATEQATIATNAASAAQTAQTATETARDEAAAQATVATEQAAVATEQATAAAAAAAEAKDHRGTAYIWMNNAAESATTATEQATIATEAATAAETSAANVAEDEQEIAANAAAAAESATAAALSEANAKTYMEQAKSLSEDSLSLIGLGADRRDWPDCTVNPSAYIGFVRLEEATATGFPSIASGEVYLVGWLARGDGLIINGCFVGTNTRSLYTYMYNNADGTYGWTRHARKDEVSRLLQTSNSTGETQLWDGVGQNYIFVNNTGWGAYSVDGAIKLGINYGGTGGGNAGQARTNLQVMYEQKTDLADTDLDTLTGEYSGFYRQKLNAQATTDRHYPCNNAGALVVIGNSANTDSGCTQIYYPYNYNASFYLRSFDAATFTWSEWARFLSSGVLLGDIGLTNAPRDCADISGNPAAYIGFIRIREGVTGWPEDVADGEAYLTGFISVNDGSPSYTGIFQGWGTRSLYTYRWSESTGPQWTRHARKNEVSRFNQSGSNRTVVYSMDDSTAGCYLQLDATGRWGYYSPVDNCWKALAIEQGGTGAVTVDEARENLKVDRLAQWGSETWVYNADSSMRLGLTGTSWGCYSDTQSKWIPLDLSHGGTGANDAATARTNLAAMHEQKSSLADTDLDTLTAAYSGVYWQGASSKATTELHYPCKYGGALVVLKNGNYTNGATQLYYPYNSTGLYYMRTYYANLETWTDWAKFESDPLIHEEAPFPDVWIPFNDSLDMLAGFAPGYKKVTVNDETTSIPSDKVVGFARASTATYINKSGVLTIADIDEPRFEREGLLIEGTRTNFFINGSVPASWGRSTNITATAETDSYGFLYGKFVIDDSAVGGTGACNMASVITANVIDTTQHDEQYVTVSCRFRSSSDVRLRIRFAGGEDTSSLAFLCDAYIKLSDMTVTKAGGGADNITVSVTTDNITGWNRAVVTYKSTVTLVTAQIQLAPVSAFVSGDYMELATPQVELGPNASSYICSGSTPSTRASDLVSITTKNNLARPPFSFLIELHKDWFRAPNAAPRVFDIANANTGQGVIAAVNRGSDKYYMSLSKSDGAYINSAAASVLPNKAIIGAVVKDDDTFHVIMNGVAVADATCSYGGVTQDKNIRFGGQTSTGERHLFGHIRNFRIWHKALTDGQLFEKV
jgi:hypothetical protein|nr:MAG TPA: tail protein [Caudoviricetes sp.]